MKNAVTQAKISKGPKRPSLAKWICILLVTLILTNPTINIKRDPEEELENRKKCDLVLMRSFKLEGMVFPAKPREITICPQVEENCCTVVDELAILKFWKEFTMDKWKKFSSYVMYLAGNIINFQPFVARMGIHNVPMFFTQRRQFEFESFTCSLIEETDQVVDFRIVRKKMSDRILKLKNKMLLNNFGGDKNKLKRYLKQEKKKEKSHLKQKNRRNQKIFIDGYSTKERRELMSKMSETEKKAFLNANSVRMAENEAEKKGRYSFMRDVRVMSKLLERKLSNTIKKVQNKIDEKMDNYEHFLAKTKLEFEPINQKYQQSVTKFIDSGKYYIEQLPDLVNYDFKSLKHFIRIIKSHMMDILDASYSAMEDANLKQSDFMMIKLLKEIEDSNMPQVLIPLIPDLTLPEIEVDPLQIPEIQCSTKLVSQTRNLLVLNTAKLEYCTNAYDVVTKMNMTEYVAFLSRIKGEMTRLISVKQGLYCVLCDVDAQAYIDKKENIMLIDRRFCGNYIEDFRFYFEFLNIIFVEYMDCIFQFLECINSPGDELEFPFFTVIEHKKRMALMWKNCFDHLGEEDQFKHCYFICKEFRYDKNSYLIEGDIHFFKTVYFELMSFMRKSKMSMVKTLGTLKKINWGLQDSPLLRRNIPFNVKKHSEKLAVRDWTPNEAQKLVAKGYFKSERILEEDKGTSWLAAGKMRPKTKSDGEYSQHDEFLYEKLINDNPNIYADHSLFFEPTTVVFKKTTLKNPEENTKEAAKLNIDAGDNETQRLLGENDKESTPEVAKEATEAETYSSPQPRELHDEAPVNREGFIQGFEPFMDQVRDGVDVNIMRRKFLEMQEEKEKAKERGDNGGPKKEIKKEEIFERIEMTVDLSRMTILWIKEDEGINPLYFSGNSCFDVNEKKLMKQNLKSISLEVIDRKVIEPVIQLTPKKIDSFNKDIDMQIRNSDHMIHTFKKVYDPHHFAPKERDFYDIEGIKEKERNKGWEDPVPWKHEDILKHYEDMKVDLSMPYELTENEELEKKIEKNPGIRSVHNVVKFFRD